MKIIRACYSPLLDLAQAISGNIYKKMLLIKSFPAQKVMVTSEPSLTSRVVSIIKCPSADPATHSILMVDHPGFQLVNAHNEYLNDIMFPVVTWTGGKPPYRFWVSYRPTGGTPDDNVLGTKIVNLAPEFLKATIGPDIYTMEGIITKNSDYYDDGWWADDGHGENPQDEIGIVIEDSSDTPMQIFVPFTPLTTDPNYDKYTGTGHAYGPDTWCPCPFEFILSSPITYGEDITWLSEPRGRIPGTNTEVEGTFGVYLDSACTIVADLTLPNAGAYSLFVQFVPNDTTHLKTNVKTQTVVVNKVAQEALSIEFRRYFSAYSPYVSSVGDIDGSNVFVYNTASGNPINFWTEPAGAAVFTPNNIAATYSGIDENGVPRNDQYGTKYTWVASGTITFYAQQAESTNYSASPVWSQEIFVSNRGAYLIHECLGGGVGGGTTETVNFYPDKHVCAGGGVGGGTIKTVQHKTHYCVGGGVGGGTTIVLQNKENQTIDSLLFFDFNTGDAVDYTWMVEQESPTISIVGTCTSDLPIVFTVAGTALDIAYGTYFVSELGDYFPTLSGPGTFKTVKMKRGILTIVASQDGNAYWNAATPITYEIDRTEKKMLTFTSLTWYSQFTYGTVDHSGDYAYCAVLLSENILCTVTVSAVGLVINGAPSLVVVAPYKSGTGIHFYSITPGSYTCTASVINHPTYADFSYTFAVTVPGAPARQLNSLSGFPPYFVLNDWNQIGGVRLASMLNPNNVINDYTAVTGTNKIHSVQEPQENGTNKQVTFTLGATPVFGGSPRYTSSTVYMTQFDSGCTMRIQHLGNDLYFPYDNTILMTATGVVVPPPPPPEPEGESWHVTYYQCNAAVLFKRYDSFNTSNNIYGVWRIGAAINGSATINAYVTWGWNDLYYHTSHDGDFAADFLGLTASEFYYAFIASTGYWGVGSIDVLWQFHITQIEYYY